MSSPTYVLVHGAFGGAWCWRDLGAEFDRRSLSWVAMDLPSAHDPAGLATLGGDADAVVATARDLGPIVLVGHSYGGSVVAEAVGRLPQVESVIFVAAIVAGPGESATQVSRRGPERTLLDEAMVVDGPLVRLDPDLAGAALYGRCDDATRAWALPQLGAHTLASFRCARTAPDPQVPRRYVVCSDDHAVHPVLQVSLATACDEWVSLDTDHSPMLSTPAMLCDLITVADAGV